MTQSGDTPNLIQLDTEGRIDEELPCMRCAYNLYRAQPDNQCPECGAQVHDTVRLAKLRGFDPKWLKRIAGALILVAISAGLMSGLHTIALSMQHLPGGLPGGFHRIILPIFGFAMVIIGLIGFWRLTTPLQTDNANVIGQRLPRIARPCMTLGLSGILLDLIAEQSQMLSAMLVVRYILGPAIFGLLAVGLWTTLMYGARLAMLVPQLSLARQARIIAWGYAAVMIAFVLLTAFRQLMESPGMFALVIMYSTVGALILLGIWSIPLCIWYRRRFLEAAKMA